MVQLCSYRGKCHLPLPTGRYSVGACDLMTKKSLMRCFYPCSEDPQATFAKSSLWLKWFPSLEYADGYLRFKFSRSIPFSARLLRWMTNDPYCPVANNEPLLPGDGKLPLIIFSHGMGACRTTYSMLLTEMASQGYFVAAVEHRDGSAAATVIDNDGKEEFVYERKLLPDEKEYPLRNSQVSTRIDECFDALEIVHSLTKGEFSDFDWVKKPEDQFLNSVKDRLQLDKTIVAGHSFGGVTAVKAVVAKNANSKLSFEYGVCLDSWLYPIRQEAEDLVSNWTSSHPPNLFFVNCENFQSANNLKTMKNFEHTISDQLQTNVFTMRNTIHYAPTDIPTIFLGSWAKFPYQLLFKKAPNEGDLDFPVEKALTLTGQLFLAYLKSVRDNVGIEELEKCLDENEKYLIRGAGFKEEEAKV